MALGGALDAEAPDVGSYADGADGEGFVWWVLLGGGVAAGVEHGPAAGENEGGAGDG